MITFPNVTNSKSVASRRSSIRHGGARANVPLRYLRIAIDFLNNSLAPATDQSCAATSSANALIGVGALAPPSRANPHSARGIAAPAISRGFVPWRLSDAGLGASRIAVDGRHPKPSTKPDSCNAATGRRHSMSWSARRRNDFEIVSPSAFAVFRLMTSANLMACWTGRSEGLAPFKIFVDVGSGAPYKVRVICVIGHQATGFSLNRKRVHCWQSIASRQFAHAGALSNE